MLDKAETRMPSIFLTCCGRALVCHLALHVTQGLAGSADDWFSKSHAVDLVTGECIL